MNPLLLFLDEYVKKLSVLISVMVNGWTVSVWKISKHPPPPPNLGTMDLEPRSRDRISTLLMRHS